MHMQVRGRPIYKHHEKSHEVVIYKGKVFKLPSLYSVIVLTLGSKDVD